MEQHEYSNKVDRLTNKAVIRVESQRLQQPAEIIPPNPPKADSATLLCHLLVVCFSVYRFYTNQIVVQ